ncbi:MAG: glycosyl hydrolase family 65 protein, partial [bacterium]
KQVRVNYEYYNARTDHTYGSSLGPAIQAVMACRAGRIDDAREHFIRAASADLLDVRGNAKDGIHAASAAGVWLAVVFGFAGLRVDAASTLTGADARAPGGPDWTVTPRLPEGWTRLAFKFMHRGRVQAVEIAR